MIATTAAIAITVVLLLLFRIPPPATPLAVTRPAAAAKASVQVARPDETDMLLKAEADLRDLRPLFLPTDRNAALPEPRLEPGRTFLEADTFQPKPSGLHAKITEDLPPPATLDGQPVAKAAPAAALSLTENPLSAQGFGRAPIQVRGFEGRGGFVEVTALSNGTRVLAEALPGEARPAGDKPWAPVEFIAAVDEAGLVSPLVVTEGSRVEEVDVHFRNYLATTFRIGQRLEPGFYRITVAP